ncbi:CHAT domain-containing protein [Thioflexithrix psekupsensis]|uniref:CHAT domain-containing protein n=1 Tax=Thioflexithrix psekupsensis TaxID=1570016 RepID=A0A251XAZ1_9GAMM|nr:CHAT domain-containing protein [Thioflexithrix psekupsensis]OUD15529.1 hypothetical protein TPSD3_03140 [Thioflexithrix psekupsensis]
MSTSTFFLKNNRLTLTHGEIRESFDVDNVQVLQECSTEYLALVEDRKQDNRAGLLVIGEKLAQWLNKTSWVERLRDEVRDQVWDAVFQVPARPNDHEIVFLNAPWELLAWKGKHLALDDFTWFNAMRRIGEIKENLTPSLYRLNLMFMAAAPEQSNPLSYEAEEWAILNATSQRDMDLMVEETGMLSELASEVARYQPDVVHVSCHGGFDKQDNPILSLENEEGYEHSISFRDWRTQASLSNVEKGIKLAFISACHTANLSPKLTHSFATQLIQIGMPAVLGWGNSVGDIEAGFFAKYFYKDLAQKQSLPHALANARYQLFIEPPEQKTEKREKYSRDWHLARLFLGQYDIGALTESDRAKRPLPADFGEKAFLDTKKQVPVAGRSQFVGRRRALQAIIREFRNPQQAGVLIHGMGRQGKSSLAARIARRLLGHKTLVVYGHYEAVDILRAFRDVGSDGADRIIEEYTPIVAKEPPKLAQALRKLLCEQEKPFLLVIDDFEQILVEPREKDGFYTVRAEEQQAIRALLQAFHQHRGETASRLMITSRYRFELFDECGKNLAETLLHWHLAPMDWMERRKQLDLQQRTLSAPQVKAFYDNDELYALQDRCLESANGNPGLQFQLYTLLLHDKTLAAQTLDEVDKWLVGDQATVPDEKTRDLLEGLVLDKLHGLLSASSQQLLQWSQDFVMPLPLEALKGVSGENAVQGLLTLGLWDGWRDEETKQPAALLNQLAKRLCQDLNDEQKQEIAQQLLNPLWTVWQPVQRSYQADYQLTRLAVRVGDAAVLQHVAGNGVRWVSDLTWKHVDFREGKELGLKSIVCLENKNITPDNRLLRYTAESCHRTGEVDKALQLHQRRLEILPKDKEWERAVAAGGIADILEARGQLDEALRIRQEEQLPVYERLGDVREKAMTMGKIADILEARGQLDEALRIRQKEELPVYERLGDVHSGTVIMSKIADTLQKHGQLDDVLRIHQEEILPVFKRLGDVHSEAVTKGKIADILQVRGKSDEALRIFKEEVLPVFEQLGDARSKAMIMGKIANILRTRGQLNEALCIYRENIHIREQLGDVCGKAVTQNNMAVLLMQFNPPRRAEANQLLCEALHAAQQMRIPEAGQIRQILQHFEMQCENDEGISVEEMLQVVFSELSRLPEEQRADAFNAFLSQFPDEIKEAILQMLKGN